MSIPSSDSAAIRQVIRALKKAGYTPLVVDDGEEQHRAAFLGENDLIGHLMSVDASWLYVTKDQKRSSVFFVLGNDPEEVINDYSWDLDPVIGALLDRWID